MIKNKIVAFILFIVAFFVFWNLCDYLFTRFISHGVFTFTVFGDAIMPTVAAVVVGSFVIFRKK